MNTSKILEDQVVHVKRGRMTGLGFEPVFNAYYDFYLDSKYFKRPLLELEDVTFLLYLRKNLNDRNPRWKMPTIRQMKKKFQISQSKIEAMMSRLEKAHLLKKESGIGRRDGGQIARNDYILSDPIPTLNEFLEVAEEGVFGQPLLATYVQVPSTESRYKLVLETGTSLVPETGTDQQTLNTKQTSEEQVDPRLEDLRFQIGEKTFNRFMSGAQVVSIEAGVAVIGTPYAYAKDWIENRLSDKLKRSLGVESIRCMVLTE